MAMTSGGLVKLLEEMGELAQVVAKKIAFYDTDEHPDGKGSLSVRIEEEIADVFAASWFVVETMKLSVNQINKRTAAKLHQYWTWHVGAAQCQSTWKTRLIIDLSEYTPLEVDRPSHGQKCSVVLLGKHAELLDYRDSIEWDNSEQDWYADAAEEHYFCGSEYLPAISFAREFSYSFYWKPVPCK